MTTEYKLKTYIEWTDEDRAKGECPVPDWSLVTVWFEDGDVCRGGSPQHWDWGEADNIITAYLIHGVPREPIVRWMVDGGANDGYCYHKERYAKNAVANHGGRVVKLVEEV